MKQLNASFFGLELSVSNDTLMTILLIVEAVICVLLVALMIYVLHRKKPTEAQQELAAAEPEPEPVPEPVPEPEPVRESVPVPVPVIVAEPEEEYEWRAVKSFMARYILSDDDVKGRYGNLKNIALGYERIRTRVSFKRESFFHRREALLRFFFRGKTLCLCLALDPAQFEGTKYHVEDLSELPSYADTPCMIRLTGSRKEKHAAELIGMVMEAYGIPAVERPAEDYYLPVQSEAELIEAGLIKMVKVRRDPNAFAHMSEGTEAAVHREVAAAEPEPVPEPAPVPVIVAEPEEYEWRAVKSFMARCILADDEVKGRYGNLKNIALGYERLRSHLSFKRESFYHGREALLRLFFRGKTLCICLALDPAQFEGTKYHVEDLSELPSYADTPCMLRITGSRKEKHAAELIGMVMEAYGIPAVERPAEEDSLPVQSEAELIEAGLIKMVKTRRSSSVFVQKEEGAEEGKHE